MYSAVSPRWILFWYSLPGMAVFLRVFLSAKSSRTNNHSGQVKQFEATSFEFDFQPSLSTEFTDQNCFLFWQMVPKIYDKDRKINVFCLPCVNCGISSHLDEFWDGFCCAFLLAASHHYIKIEKAGNFVRLLDTVAHRKRPNSPISTHRTATIFTQLTLKIFDHVHAENCHDPTHITASSVHSKITVVLILAFAIGYRQIWGDILATWQVKFFPATIPKVNFNLKTIYLVRWLAQFLLNFQNLPWVW